MVDTCLLLRWIVGVKGFYKNMHEYSASPNHFFPFAKASCNNTGVLSFRTVGLHLNYRTETRTVHRSEPEHHQHPNGLHTPALRIHYHRWNLTCAYSHYSGVSCALAPAFAVKGFIISFVSAKIFSLQFHLSIQTRFPHHLKRRRIDQRHLTTMHAKTFMNTKRRWRQKLP